MLTEHLFASFKRYVNAAYYTHCLELRIKGRRLESPSSGIHQRVTRFCIFMYTIYGFYQTYNCLRNLGLKSSTSSSPSTSSSSSSVTNEVPEHIADIFAVNIFICWWYNLETFLHRKNDYVWTMNSFLSFRNEQAQPKGNKFKVTSSVLDNVQLNMLPLHIFTAVSFGAVFLEQPNNPRYIYSTIPEEWQKKGGRLLFGVFVCIEMWAPLILIFPSMVTFISLNLYAVFTQFWLQKLKDSTTKIDNLSEEIKYLGVLSDTMTCIKEYQELRVLNIIFNDSIGSTLVSKFAYQTLLSHGLLIVAAIKLRKIMPLPTLFTFTYWAITLFILEAAVFLRFGILYETSNQLIHRWSSSLPFHNRKFVRHLRPMGIQWGDFVRKTTGLVIILYICKATKNLFLIF